MRNNLAVIRSVRATAMSSGALTVGCRTWLTAGATSPNASSPNGRAGGPRDGSSRWLQALVKGCSTIWSGRRRNYTDATLGQVEGALGWEPGEIRARAEGHRLRRAPDREMRRIQDAWPHLSTDARRILAALAEIGAATRP